MPAAHVSIRHEMKWSEKKMSWLGHGPSNFRNGHFQNAHFWPSPDKFWLDILKIDFENQSPDKFCRNQFSKSNSGQVYLSWDFDWAIFADVSF
jgi:hypothetical protein